MPSSRENFEFREVNRFEFVPFDVLGGITIFSHKAFLNVVIPVSLKSPFLIHESVSLMEFVIIKKESNIFSITSLKLCYKVYLLQIVIYQKSLLNFLLLANDELYT
jgi:hypothetical protein